MSKGVSYRTIKNVLTVIKNGESKPNRISYQSNVSWARLMNCLTLLLNKGCVECSQRKVSSDHDLREYFITNKGEHLLQSLQIAKKIIDK
ncbi:winged helix-turn-helix domain-containing protein [Thermoproteota archaeon]